ncbi:hypothetical protein C0J52_08047 [Blattella germanica]|nr:hypothetical protein C0J52_08047 [Blattella germanica]
MVQYIYIYIFFFFLFSSDSNEIPLQKKHKKHKHKKHKKKKVLEESEGSQDMSFDDGDPSKPTLKLKIKFTPGEKNAGPSGSGEKTKEKTSPSKAMEKSGQVGSSPKTSAKKKKTKGKDSGTSSEEERWLDAIESGKLEEVDDELKKIKPKDPKLMTARQRAMFERKTDKEPSKKTMERLLKKQESKAGKSSNRTRSARKQVPRISYRSTADGISISLPPSVDFPLQPQSIIGKPLPVLIHCGVEGCTNVKKYSCSRTGIPLCSLECYRKNLASLDNSGRGN